MVAEIARSISLKWSHTEGTTFDRFGEDLPEARGSHDHTSESSALRRNA